ncbi:MAG: TolC family protein [Candidatus Riflebacteria bacterium]|nr:TolC family protein [Candidatus Riflebacteria bacterium]
MSRLNCPGAAGILLLASTLALAGGPALSVDEAVDRALRSGEIDARVQGVEEALGRLQQKRAWPSAVVTYDRQHILDRNGSPGFAQDLLKLEQPLVAAGLRAGRTMAGEGGVEVAQRELAMTRNKKILEVRKAFARVLEAQRVVEIYGHSRVHIRTAQEIIRARVRAGESSRYENVRIELADAQERDQATAAVVDRTRAVSEMASAMGVSLPPDTVVTGTLPGPLFFDPDDSAEPRSIATAPGAPDRAGPVAKRPARGATEEALARRPEVALELWRVRQAEMDERVAKAEMRPQFAIGLGYMGFDQSGMASQSGYNAIVSVSLPWSERRRGEMATARARTRAAEYSRTATTARVTAEIEGSRQNLQAASARLHEVLSRQQTKVDEMVSIAETSYRAGLHSLLELLDAYRLERDFQIARVRAQGALQQALEEYCHAVGVPPIAILARSRDARTK